MWEDQVQKRERPRGCERRGRWVCENGKRERECAREKGERKRQGVCEREENVGAVEKRKRESVSDKFTRERHREREKESQCGSGKVESV